MTLSLRVGARSDVGLVREGNEDSLYAGHQLLAVADGVGGSVAGEIASSETIRALEPLEHENTITDPLGALREAVMTANRRLRDRADADPELQGMGTTLTAMLWVRQRLGLAQVGDSRAYQLRGGSLEQITRDQTFVQLLLDEGRITPEQAVTHPQRSVILNALDGRSDVEPDLSMRDVAAGDRYLLCSDGLSDYVTPEDLSAGLTEADPQAASDRLVDLALRAGGPDNITCIVIDVVDDDIDDTRLPILAGAVAQSSADTDPRRTDTPAAATGSASDGRRSRSIGRRLAVVGGLVVLLIAGAVVATAVYVHHQWYIADTVPGSPPGNVGIYQGVQGKVLGITGSHLHSPTDIPVTALPQDDAEKVADGISAGNLAAAQSLVAGLRTDACQLASASPRPTASSNHGRHPAPAPSPSWCIQ